MILFMHSSMEVNKYNPMQVNKYNPITVNTYNPIKVNKYNSIKVDYCYCSLFCMEWKTTTCAFRMWKIVLVSV